MAAVWLASPEFSEKTITHPYLVFSGMGHLGGKRIDYWCTKNIETGDWYRLSLTNRYRFRRQEDAALFMLHWGGE